MKHQTDLDRSIERLSVARREDKPMDPFRISNCGKCCRALGYMAMGKAPKPLRGRAVRVFEIGDYVHHYMQKLLGQAGLASRFEEEVTLKLPLDHRYKGKVKTLFLTGHIDGVYHDPEQGDKLMEVKSTTAAGFRMVKATEGGDIDESYLCQNVAYQYAVKLDGIWVYYNKDTSDIYTFYANKQVNAETLGRIRNRYTRLMEFLDSGAEEPPESLREYGPVPETYRRKPTGRMKLPWNCTYCPFPEACWPEATLEVVGGKPVMYV